jgi:hypothetical protein
VTGRPFRSKINGWPDFRAPIWNRNGHKYFTTRRTGALTLYINALVKLEAVSLFARWRNFTWANN